MSHRYSMTRLAVLAAFGASLIACSDRNDSGTEPGPPRTDIGDSFVVTSANRILSVAAISPGVTRTAMPITGLAPGETIKDVDARPATLVSGNAAVYLLGSTGQLYTLDTTTGLASAVIAAAPLPLDATKDYGIDFNPLVDRLRVVNSDGQNLRVNVDTGGVTTDTKLTRGGVDQLGVGDVAYSNSIPDYCATRLFYIDPITDRLLSTTAPNDGLLTSVGPLGVDASTSDGFDLVGSASSALTLLTVGGVPGFYLVNISTGTATLRAPLAGLNAGEVPVGLVGTLDDTLRPTGNMAAVTTEATPRLITFNRADPTRVCTDADIAILDDDGEPIDGLTLLGIDSRQSDGALYGLASDGSVVTLDPATGEGAVVLAGLARNDGTGTAEPVALDGTVFGVDFNPDVDRLRIVSDTGQNLRVNLAPVDDPATTTVDESEFNTIVDGALNVGGVTQSGVAGAGYTTNDPDADSDTAPVPTQLYYVKTDTDQLFTTGTPSTGTLSLVGALGVDADATVGFDIINIGGFVGNSAFMVTNAPGTATSSIYSVNLATGAATLLTNAVGGSVIGGGAAIPPGLLSGAAVIAP